MAQSPRPLGAEKNRLGQYFAQCSRAVRILFTLNAQGVELLRADLTG